MMSLPSAPTHQEVETLFTKLEMADKSMKGIYYLLPIYRSIKKIDFYFLDWVKYYRQSYVIGSLNWSMSRIPKKNWQEAPDNTNAAEAAHAMSNREGKQLKLLTAILR